MKTVLQYLFKTNSYQVFWVNVILYSDTVGRILRKESYTRITVSRQQHAQYTRNVLCG